MLHEFLVFLPAYNKQVKGPFPAMSHIVMHAVCVVCQSTSSQQDSLTSLKGGMCLLTTAQVLFVTMVQHIAKTGLRVGAQELFSPPGAF